MFDPHCHLQLSPLFEEWESLLARAHSVGVAGCLVPSYGPEEWERQDRLLTHQGVYQGLGIHPWWVPGQDLGRLLELLNEAFLHYPKRWGSRLRAVGEFGLDRANPERKACFETQRVLFREHLKWAEQLSLPVILHLVKAHGAAYELLSGFTGGGVIHSFSGPKELLHQYREFDLYFSYSGALATSEKAREALRSTPPDRLMFETDGPHGAALGKNGLLSPASLPVVVQIAAEVLGKSVEWCRSVHRENCRRLFALE
ncbi:MAG: TatD family hydrolase [Vulcanimicrobiota bacterium]